MKVEYNYYVCQKCDFTGGSSDFTFIHKADDYDIDFHCPKCGSIDVKKRLGITTVDPTSMEIEKMIRSSQSCTKGEIKK
jgi:Zn finger protein HypA/HybF involved in hydrogenase expression